GPPEGCCAPGGPAARSTGARAQTAAPTLPNIGTWQNLGPTSLGGRLRGLVADPANPGTMYAGGVGGVWKTTDGGATWTPAGEETASVFVSSIAIDPTDSQTLLAGTGEQFAYSWTYGNGIFKSTDGGAHWTLLAATDPSNTADFGFVNKIVYSAHAGVVYAAALGGVLRSTDSGTSWTAILQPTSSQGESECDDLAVRTDAGHEETLFASCGAFSS